MDVHSGSCHCGAVRFEVDADLDDERILDCNCSMCTRKGYLHLIVDRERFRLLAGEEALTEYRFGTKIAIHRFCRHCGIHPFYRPRSHPEMVSVNVRCLDDIELETIATEPFDGANWEKNIDSIRR